MTPRVKGKEHNRGNGSDGTITRTDGTGCTRPWITVIVVSLALAGLLIFPVSAVSDESLMNRAPTPKVTHGVIYYQEFARNLLTTHPELKTMSDMEKAKFAFSAYSRELRRLNEIYVNKNNVDRLSQGGEHTCSWHTDNLQKIMRIFGVKEVHSIVADKKTWKPFDENSPSFSEAESWNFLDVNSNHQAVLVIIDGKQYVFDVWKMAVDNHGVYKDLDANFDRYNGMPIEDWNTVMRVENYIRFTADSETVDPKADIWYPSCSEAVNRINTVHRDTEVKTTGMQTVTLPKKEFYFTDFKIPDGYSATGLKVTYDAKPGPGETLILSLTLTNPYNSNVWQITHYWENNGYNSGRFETKGILDTLILKPGTYQFMAVKTYNKEGIVQHVPVSASLSFYQSEPFEVPSENMNR
jgi:hypothetical protein